MRTEIIGVEESNKSFFTRFWRATHVFILLFLFLGLYLLVDSGPTSYTLIFIGSMFVLVGLYGVRVSANILYKIYLNDEQNIEIETLHFNKIKKIVRNRKDVKVKVIQDATARYIIDMIRIDVDKRTYFTQKQFKPWSRERIQWVKDIVEQGIL
ncbi:hypothetical protein EGT74_01510 [Chitinophaga lutea]|uniref:Uncharacterized protein n=1 Tax=Chitinophaga lutea TaxID=2488634 RepID=A0A3N4Q467_9BACT|nr:hypothetical protein [Chitinophaga lutea]RPE12261.1 hypothetical protein EGT74_01510 [Chitinophaga lutea]